MGDDGDASLYRHSDLWACQVKTHLACFHIISEYKKQFRFDLHFQLPNLVWTISVFLVWMSRQIERKVNWKIFPKGRFLQSSI